MSKMMPKLWLLVLASLAGLAVVNPVGDALSAPPGDRPPAARPPGDRPPGGPGFLINPQQMLEFSVQDATRRYNLDADQQELTRQILGAHGKAFFDKHLDEIKALQIEAMKMRFSGEEDPETVKALAGRFKAVFEQARVALEAAGDEFHDILDDEQADQHDTDRRNLREGLDRAAAMLDKTIADGVTPWARERQAAGETAEAQRRRMRWTGGGFVEREWEGYTEAFIAHYKLDDGQSALARQMLDLARKDAADYRKSHEKAIAEIVEAYRIIGREERDPATTAARKAELAAARKPLDADAAAHDQRLERLFKDLREALDSLPSAEQKRRSGPFAPARRRSVSGAGAPMAQP